MPTFWTPWPGKKRAVFGRFGDLEVGVGVEEAWRVELWEGRRRVVLGRFIGFGIDVGTLPTWRCRGCDIEESSALERAARRHGSCVVALIGGGVSSSRAELK